MSSERIKGQLAGSRSSKRYHSGDFSSLEEVSDPRTRDDEATTSWREWIAENSRFAGIVIAFLSVTIAVFVWWTVSFAPSLFRNPWVQRGTAVTVIVSVSYVVGVKSQSSRFNSTDELVLLRTGGIQRYDGYYVETDEGTAPLFIPIRGFKWLNHVAVKYRLRDLSREIAELEWNQNRDLDDPVVVRLNPEFASTTYIDGKFVIGQLSEGLEPDEYGSESNVFATLPDVADDDAIGVLKAQLQESNSEIKELESRVQMLKRQRDNAKEEARESREETINSFIMNHARLKRSESGMTGGMPGAGGFGSEPGWEEEEPGTVDFDEIEEEMEFDEDE